MASEQAVQVIEALDQGLPHVGSICLHFYGGEPLLDLSVMKTMVEKAKQRHPGRFRFSITTNGTINSPDVFDLLEEGKFYVILSIDGPAGVHNECRRTKGNTATHELVMQFLENLRSRTNCAVRGSAVVRANWRLSQASAYLRSLPVDSIKAQAVRVPGGAAYALNEGEKQLYRRDLEEIGQQVIADLESGRPPKDDRFSNRVLQLLTGKKRSSFCGAGQTAFGITPDGTILPCVLLDAELNKLGHIFDDPTVWTSAGKSWQAAHQAKQRCITCPAFPLCGGGCPAIMPVCGEDECDLIRHNCDIAAKIFEHFRTKPDRLLALAGIT
jgi:uncharacterized protein